MASTSLDFDAVVKLGLELFDVEESRYYGARALKRKGRMLVCEPVNKSAEPNSAVVAVSVEQRDALLHKYPSFCYLTDHYAGHSSMLIRLAKMSRNNLEQVLRAAWIFVEPNPN